MTIRQSPRSYYDFFGESKFNSEVIDRDGDVARWENRSGKGRIRQAERYNSSSTADPPLQSFISPGEVGKD